MAYPQSTPRTQTITCAECGQVVMLPLVKGVRKFCSDQCRNRYKNKKRPVTLSRVCAWCDTPFTVGRHHGRQKYCNDVCRTRSQSQTRPARTMICTWCKEPFEVSQTNNWRKFCTSACKDAFNASPEGKARYKGRYNGRYKDYDRAWYNANRRPLTNPNWRHDGRTLVAWNKGKTIASDPRVAAYAEKQRGVKRKPLSDEQRAHMKANARRGSANNRWKGGITPQNVKERGSEEYKQWRAAVYRRDRWTCTNCGTKAHGKGTIVAHHILDWENHPSERYITENGSTLCRPCHALLDPKIHDNKRGWDKPHLRKIVRGEGSYHAKLTEHQAVTAIAAMKAGDTVAMLARHYGIAYSSMDDIKHVRTWKHLDREAIEACPLSAAMPLTGQLRLDL